MLIVANVAVGCKSAQKEDSKNGKGERGNFRARNPISKQKIVTPLKPQGLGQDPKQAQEQVCHNA